MNQPPVPPVAAENSPGDSLEDAAVGSGRGRLWIVVAALLWSSSGLFAKAPIFDDWPVESRGVLLAFWRALFAGAILLPAVRSYRFTPGLVPLCVSFVIMNASYLSAMTVATAASAIWLQSTAPWWVYLAGLMLGRETVERTERVPLLLGGLGLAIILAFEAQGQARWGVALGLLSGLSYAAVVMSLRALRGEDSVWLVSIAHLVTAACLLPFIVWIARWPSGTQLVVLAAFGFFQMALPYVCFARGLKSITAQEATGIGLLEPLLMPLWVFLVWGERPAMSTLAGGSLIIAGLALRYLLPLSDKPNVAVRP